MLCDLNLKKKRKTCKICMFDCTIYNIKYTISARLHATESHGRLNEKNREIIAINGWKHRVDSGRYIVEAMPYYMHVKWPNKRCHDTLKYSIKTTNHHTRTHTNVRTCII